VPDGGQHKVVDQRAELLPDPGQGSLPAASGHYIHLSHPFPDRKGS
jgi:hypothetical protein